MKKFLKGFGIVFCCMGLLVYTYGIFKILGDPASTAPWSALLFMDGLMLLSLYLLLRKPKRKIFAEQDTIYTCNLVNAGTIAQVSAQSAVEVPNENLQDMKKHYTATQAQNDIRIMKESFTIAQQTTDFETFFMRLQLAQKCALTLLQSKKADCKCVKQTDIETGCTSVLSSVQNLKIVFLDNSYRKEVDSALQLKTEKGRINRLTKYLDKLKSYADWFVDVETIYQKTVQAVESSLHSETGNDLAQPPAPSDTNSLSSADEILKFKQLLDVGAITQEEYDTKKNELLTQ